MQTQLKTNFTKVADLRVLHISTFDGSIGGATRSAQRIHNALRFSGIDSHFLVQTKGLEDLSVHEVSKNHFPYFPLVRACLDALPLLKYPKWDRKGFWPQWVPNRALQLAIEEFRPDVVNLHWVTRGFLPIEQIGALDVPIVWTLHDMWAFTGGCYYSGNCQNYQNTCGSCFKLGSTKSTDLSSRILERKLVAWENAQITIVSPSNWLANAARHSTVFKNALVETIPYPIDMSVFTPQDKDVTRKALKLPRDKTLILFGATNIDDERKGFHLLQESLNILDKNLLDNLELVVFGKADSDSFETIPIKTNYLGCIADNSKLAKIYSGVDLYVACSLEDNLPNTVIEASCCGTPSVAFNIGGLPDLVQHNRSGYLATPFSINDLAKGISWCVESEDRLEQLSATTYQVAEKKFAPQRIAEQYTDLYLRILGRN